MRDVLKVRRCRQVGNKFSPHLCIKNTNKKRRLESEGFARQRNEFPRIQQQISLFTKNDLVHLIKIRMIYVNLTNELINP